MKGFAACLALVIGILLAAPAWAQDTGGSMGGGDWSGGGGGGGGYDSSSSYSSSSSSDDSYSGSDYTYSNDGDYSGGGGGGSVWMLVVLLVLVGGGNLIAQMIKDSGRPQFEPVYDGGFSPMGSVDVTALRVGLDARVRPFVQKELARIAAAADTRTQQGLVTMLHEVALLLRRLRDAWTHGGAVNFAMTPQAMAQSTFQAEAAKARETFRQELVRNAAGATSTAEATTRAVRSDEGAGLVLVTLIVAARQELFTVSRVGDGADLRRALEVLSALTAQTLVAVEIVWTPAAEGDRMSSVELEALWPGQVFPIAGAMVGKVVCAYCSGPFPAELMSCPHCGAPARDAHPAARAAS